jgi:hypothetical protein
MAAAAATASRLPLSAALPKAPMPPATCETAPRTELTIDDVETTGDAPTKFATKPGANHAISANTTVVPAIVK